MLQPWDTAVRADTPLVTLFWLLSHFVFISVFVSACTVPACLPACFPSPTRPHTLHLTPCQSPSPWTPCPSWSLLNLDYLVSDTRHSLSGLGSFLPPVLTLRTSLGPAPLPRCLRDCGVMFGAFKHPHCLFYPPGDPGSECRDLRPSI